MKGHHGFRNLRMYKRANLSVLRSMVVHSAEMSCSPCQAVQSRSMAIYGAVLHYKRLR